MLLQSNFITECCDQLKFFRQSVTFGGNIDFAGDGTSHIQYHKNVL